MAAVSRGAVVTNRSHGPLTHKRDGHQKGGGQKRGDAAKPSTVEEEGLKALKTSKPDWRKAQADND